MKSLFIFKKAIVLSLPILLFILISEKAFAQKQIQGTVHDEMEQPLPFANVVLLNISDSSIVAHTATDDMGVFQFDLKSSQNPFLISINYIGYEPLKQNLNAEQQSNSPLNLGVIKLTPLSKLLSEAVITATREPVQIRGDTMAFDAKAFNTQPNDMAAELIKKLPGVELEKDGTIQAQGEQVQQILVNGKPFFGNDPQVALQNLPADAIESIEIYDKKSDQAEFTGIDDGSRKKTINIRLKPTFTRQTNGRMTGGYGTDNRYTGRMNLNSFTEKHKLTVLGSANNINKTGFAEEDFSAFTGQNNRNSGSTSQRQPQQNTSKGFQELQSGGTNYTGTFSDKTDITASYFYNNQNTLTDRQLDRQSFLTTGSYFTHALTLNDVTNRNHRVNVQLDQKLDSLTSIRFTSSLSLSKNLNDLGSQSRNLRGDTLLQNQQKKHSYTEGGGLANSNSFLIRRKLNKAGRTLSLNLSYSRNESDRDAELQSKINYFNSLGQNYRNDTIDQTDARTNYRNNYSSSLSYTEPLSKKTTWETSYRFGLADNIANRDVYSIKNGESQFNSQLSNLYKNAFIYHRLGSNLRVKNTADFNFTIGGQYQNSVLKGTFITLKDTVEQTYRYFLPTMRLEYSINKQKRLNFNFDTDVNEPSIDQLQPVRDNSDPLNLYFGNENLRPEYNSRLRLMYTSFNKKTFTYFNGNINGTYTTNKIANQLTVDTALRRTTMPVNTPSAAQLSAHTALGFRMWRNRLRFNWTTNNSYNTGISFINNEENTTYRLNAASGLRAELNIPDTFELSFKASVKYNQTDYSLQTNLSQWYVSYDYEAEMSITLPYNTRIRSNFDYSIQTGKAFGTTPGIPILGLSFSKFLDDNRRNEIRLMVVDALNRNTGINRYADGNYVQEERIRSLGRYGMLSFTYFFSDKSGKKGGKGGKMKRREEGNDF